MKVEVIKEKCIGCGACTTIAPDTFELNDEGLAYVKNNDYNESRKEDIIDAAESCPTDAIGVEK